MYSYGSRQLIFKGIKTLNSINFFPQNKVLKFAFSGGNWLLIWLFQQLGRELTLLTFPLVL